MKKITILRKRQEDELGDVDRQDTRKTREKTKTFNLRGFGRRSQIYAKQKSRLRRRDTEKGNRLIW